MRLLDCVPRWLDIDGTRVGIVLLCPHCIAEKRPKPTPLSCFFIPTERIAGPDYHESQYALFEKMLPGFGPEYAGIEVHDFIACKRGFAWTRTGDDFASMSVTPSLDASASGHWHGYITGGEIK